MSDYENWLREFLENYYEPKVESLVVGFSGIDPAKKAVAEDINHEWLGNLLGGNAAGHYHLTQEERKKLQDMPIESKINHEAISNLLGGNSSGHYHLTKEERDKLQQSPTENNINHEKISNL